MLTQTQRESKVWDFVRDNWRRVFVWKILLGQVNKEASLDKCLLAPPRLFGDQLSAEDLEQRKGYGGNYLVWDIDVKNYVRTGKALVFTTRMKGHVSAWEDPENTITFYHHYRSPQAVVRFVGPA